jgi:hypothetical protein
VICDWLARTFAVNEDVEVIPGLVLTKLIEGDYSCRHWIARVGGRKREGL